MVEDQLETPPGVDALVERDLDDLADARVPLARRVRLDRRGHRLVLADRPEVGPGADDVAGVEQLAPTRRIAST